MVSREELTDMYLSRRGQALHLTSSFCVGGMSSTGLHRNLKDPKKYLLYQLWIAGSNFAQFAQLVKPHSPKPLPLAQAPSILPYPQSAISADSPHNLP